MGTDMTQSISLDNANVDLTLDAVLLDDIGVNGVADLPVRPGVAAQNRPWSDKSVSKVDNPSMSSPMKAQRAFLPEVKIPSSLPSEPVVIADMANLFGVTHRTLHFYEEKKILSSGRMGLMRVYSHQDVHRMAVINLLREIGVPVAAIQDIMGQLDNASSQEEADDIFQVALETRKGELAIEMSSVHRQIDQIRNLLDFSDDHDCDPDQDSIADLTEQETTCLELMSEGYSSTRMSRTLGISADELNLLEESLLGKFGVNNRFQVVAKALTMGVIQS